MSQDKWSKARGRGEGRWHHQYAKYANSLSRRECNGSIFEFSSPWDHVSKKCMLKSAFIVTAFTGSVWPISKNDEKCEFTPTSFSMWMPSWTNETVTNLNCDDITVSTEKMTPSHDSNSEQVIWLWSNSSLHLFSEDLKERHLRLSTSQAWFESELMQNGDNGGEKERSICPVVISTARHEFH